MPTIPYLDFKPEIAKTCFIAPTAWAIGKLQMHEKSALWFGAVARGDIKAIMIGEGSNIQDNAVLHTSRGRNDLVIGPQVTVGHCAILHGCQIKGSAIIGMGSTILDDAVIEENCIIGANSLVTEGKTIPAGCLALGTPAKVVRTLTPQEIQEIQDSAKSYQVKAEQYLLQFAKTGC